jgi:pyrimidine-nucleoside phosphorylase
MVEHAVGILVAHKVGDRVEKGQTLFTIHANDEKKRAEARQSLLGAHVFSDVPVAPLPLFYY